MTWLDYIIQNLMSISALIISIFAAISVRRGICSRASTDALGKVEAKIPRLQEGLDRCIKERIGFKGEILALKKALKAANIEVEELREDAE